MLAQEKNTVENLCREATLKNSPIFIRYLQHEFCTRGLSAEDADQLLEILFYKQENLDLIKSIEKYILILLLPVPAFETAFQLYELEADNKQEAVLLLCHQIELIIYMNKLYAEGSIYLGAIEQACTLLLTSLQTLLKKGKTPCGFFAIPIGLQSADKMLEPALADLQVYLEQDSRRRH